MKTAIAFVEVFFLIVHYQIILGNFSKRQYKEKTNEKFYGIMRSGSLPYSFYRWLNPPPVDDDGDGYDNTVDCNDQDASINPGVAEVCDGVDNNCDGQTDENFPLFTYYLDMDGDGFGGVNSLTSCDSLTPPGYSTNPQDCNDGDSLIHPLASEVCDSIDNNCNGIHNEGLPSITYFQDMDGDGYGSGNPHQGCAVPNGFVTNDNDCDDWDAAINPSAQEVCPIYDPSSPILDSDEDCDGLWNDDDPSVTGLIHYYVDEDCDGFSYADANMESSCFGSPCNLWNWPYSGYIWNGFGDCDDNNGEIYPSQIEWCDSLDNNCNGLIDENCFLDSAELDKPQFSINFYPNPFKDLLHIMIDFHLKLSKPLIIRCISITGQILEERYFMDTEKIYFSMGSNWNPGFYTMEVQYFGIEKRFKLIKI